MSEITVLRDITSLRDNRARHIYAFYGLDQSRIVDAYRIGLHYNNATDELLLPKDDKPLKLVYDFVPVRKSIITLHDAFIVSDKFVNHLASAAVINYELTKSDKIILDTNGNHLAIERDWSSDPLKVAHGCLASIDVLVAQMRNTMIKTRQETLKHSLRAYDNYFQ